MIKKYKFDWSELAFNSKKPLRELKATFIAAPREISVTRFSELIKENLPKGNIVLGFAKEDYIDGFDGQPQFRTLKLQDVLVVINKVNASKGPYKIYTLHYFQRDLGHILEKKLFTNHLFINGSWHKSFHTLPPYYVLANSHLPYKLVSAFVDETEARSYLQRVEKEMKKAFPLPSPKSILSESHMMDTAFTASTCSFDYSYQTGVSLGRKTKKGYEFITSSFNAVVPYQTFAMLHGASREINFSPPHDVNHYDTAHAEVFLILAAAKQKLDLKDTSFFITTLPCPTCARMLSQTDIKEFIYQNDHSDGYAIAMLKSSGKTVRRIVPSQASDV